MKLYWFCNCLISAEDAADARLALEEAETKAHDQGAAHLLNPKHHGYRPGARLTEIPEGQIIRGWGGGKMSATRWAALGRFVKDKAGNDLLGEPKTTG